MNLTRHYLVRIAMLVLILALTFCFFYLYAIPAERESGRHHGDLAMGPALLLIAEVLIWIFLIFVEGMIFWYRGLNAQRNANFILLITVGALILIAAMILR